MSLLWDNQRHHASNPEPHERPRPLHAESGTGARTAGVLGERAGRRGFRSDQRREIEAHFVRWGGPTPVWKSGGLEACSPHESRITTSKRCTSSLTGGSQRIHATGRSEAAKPTPTRSQRRDEHTRSRLSSTPGSPRGREEIPDSGRSRFSSERVGSFEKSQCSEA